MQFPKTEKIEIRLRQDLADRLPKEKSEKNAYINKAVEHELDGIKSAASIMGSVKTQKKANAARENAKKPRPLNVKNYLNSDGTCAYPELLLKKARRDETIINICRGEYIADFAKDPPKNWKPSDMEILDVAVRSGMEI